MTRPALDIQTLETAIRHNPSNRIVLARPLEPSTSGRYQLGAEFQLAVNDLWNGALLRFGANHHDFRNPPTNALEFENKLAEWIAASQVADQFGEDDLPEDFT